jgi:N-methylhydantoinase B
MTTVDPITLEVLRNRLEAIGEEAAAALERTAISPVVTESKDYSCTLLDGAGRLVIGAGQIQFHFRAASHAVRSTMARFGDEIDDGDVFVANDPHHGGGLHPQDVMVQRPVFVDGRRVAWVVMSAHMMDVGGMVAGSFAPAATECYQEALRLPPVRLFRRGREETGIWDVFRNNIRLPALVEMDMRSLVAGCHVAQDNIAGVVASMGVDTFVESIEVTRRLSESEMRRRIGLLADGRYRATSWTEWDDEFFKVPCELTVTGDRLVFDFGGASPQTTHFFNSKPYIIESEMVAQLAWLLARDLPYDDGIFAPIELRCPEGTIVNSVEPAPIAAAHMDVALNASEVGVQCVRLALGASPDHPARRYLTGWGAGSALGLHTWSCVGIDGRADAFIMLDGNWVGSSASGERDGLPLAGSILGPDHGYSFTDIEILESWYPILISEKRSRPGVNGAGCHRAGGGNQMGFRPHGTAQLTGAMLGMRRWLPLEGASGGLPGNRTQFLVHRAGDRTEEVPTHASGIVIGEGDTFQFRCASGGGFGDPLERDPELVAGDVELFALSATDAEARVWRRARREPQRRPRGHGGGAGRRTEGAPGTRARAGEARGPRSRCGRSRRPAVSGHRAARQRRRRGGEWSTAGTRSGSLDGRVPRAGRTDRRPRAGGPHPVVPRSSDRRPAVRGGGAGGRRTGVRGQPRPVDARSRPLKRACRLRR